MANALNSDALENDLRAALAMSPEYAGDELPPQQLAYTARIERQRVDAAAQRNRADAQQAATQPPRGDALAEALAAAIRDAG